MACLKLPPMILLTTSRLNDGVRGEGVCKEGVGAPSKFEGLPERVSTEGLEFGLQGLANCKPYIIPIIIIVILFSIIPI